MTDHDLTQADTVRLAIEREIFRRSVSAGGCPRRGPARQPIRRVTDPRQRGHHPACTSRTDYQTQAHKRAVVAQLDPGTMLELFEALAELEGAAVFLSTSRMSDS